TDSTGSTGSTGSPQAGSPQAARGLLLGGTVFAGAMLFWLGARPETWRELSSTSLFKLQLFSRTLTLIGDNLWLGVGRGAFETAFGPYQPGGLYTPNVVFTHPENIVLQWLSEWGVVVFALALVGLVLSLQRRLLRCEYRPATRLALIGVAVLLFQNLFDLGSEIPALMIGVCAVVGVLWSSEEATQLSESRWAQSLGRRGRVLVVGACILLSAAVTLVQPLRAVAARDALYASRDAIAPTASASKATGERAAFLARLSAALHQYPADAYLMMMGAHAWRGSDSARALRFASLALERDPKHGPAHLFVAEELWSRGARQQAMLELRLALESWPILLSEVTQRIAAWTRDPELIQRAVPEGTIGVELLSRLERIRRGDDAGVGK
ncbi:MAG TPA: O-antigen ligase family protein, partial [Polyangiaceae bacterium]|nr:O-antigen ligase family protein [Polyangiaceae bacterium]